MVSYITVNGRLTADPLSKIVKTVKGEKEVYELSIASNNYVACKTHTVFYSVTLWPGRAETLKKELKKGSAVLLTGQFYQSFYTDKSGNEKSSNHLNLHSIQLAVCQHPSSTLDTSDILSDNDLVIDDQDEQPENSADSKEPELTR